MTRTQIDKLGVRLRQGSIDESELRTLDEYRRSFSSAHGEVVRLLQSAALSPTSRTKTNLSIIDKLRRETIRLSQIQDVAGCRIVVSQIPDQERVFQSLSELFPKAATDDRRERPSHGYRAIHVIVEHAGKTIEIQIRTALQHLWAEISEKFADALDQSVKYGGGPSDVRSLLDGTSREIQEIEFLEAQIIKSRAEEKDGLLPQEVLDALESRLRIRRLEWSAFLGSLNEKLDALGK